MAGIIGDVLALGKSHSNLDFYYGPYTTLEEAYISVPRKIRGLGLTIGIYQFKENSNGEYIFNNNTVNEITGQTYPSYIKPTTIPNDAKRYSLDSIKEYLWKKGIENENLKEKVEEYVLEIDNVTYTTDTINNTITFSIRVSGRGFGVLTSIYLGSNKITSEATVLNGILNITVTAPENPGNYIYTISAVDSILGNGAQTTTEVIWKEVDVKINTSSPIYTYNVKSLLNLQNSSFTFLVFKVDSVNISKISIIYGNNSTTIYNGGEYLDTYTVNIQNLTGLKSGDLILIKIEGNLTETFIKDVVLLTAPGVYSQCEGTIPSKVYNGLSFSATFKFEAENVGNYLVVIKDNDLNIVYNSSLLSYNKNTITLTLNDPTLSEIKNSSQHILYVYIGDSLSYNYTFNTVTLMYVPNTEQLLDIDSQTKFLNSFNFGLLDNQSVTLQSYILDLVCYIPYMQTDSLVFLFGNITITKDIIQFRGITYPTPVQLDVSIGFMCNVKSSYLNTDYFYDALFINGVLCYKAPSEGSPSYPITLDVLESFVDMISNKIRLYYNTESAILLSPENFVLERNFKSRNPGLESQNLPLLNITPINNILTKADLTESLISQIVNNKVTINGTEYDIIDTTSYRVGTFGELGATKYNIANIINSFCTAYSIPLSGDESDTISKLAKAVKKNPSKIPNDYLVLTRLIVKSKKLLLKFVAVPCQWSYGELSGYLLALTLGTSTLEYALPNFTFKFFTDKTFTTKSNVGIIPKINRNLTNLLTYSNEITELTEYYNENELVAKVDYMESSHLNNTPTAMFYNALTSLTEGYTVTDSNGNEVLILRNPVPNKLNAIEGVPVVLNINNINYGSFMLNVGKAGKSIGFGSNGISLEGTSNADNSEMSSRFDFATSDTTAKAYIEGILDIDEVTTVNKAFVDFINKGLEYRYSEHELDTIGDNEGDENSPSYSEYLRILKMWHWVYTHPTYTKELFEQMFDFDFFALYYIQMMTFGLTDNLGKNCMFDLFEENGKWYVRPYDMDSLAGLENNGNDNLSPVIEISDLFVLDEDTKNIKTVPYLGADSPRFPFSSKTSNLWIRFYQNLRSDIELFYKNLRGLGYSAEAIISLCKKEVIDKLGITLYNKDFQNKYLSNLQETQLFAFGNRWFRYLDWILKRFDFCDTYFKYNVYNVNTSGDGVNYRIKYSIPLYTLYSYNNLGTTEVHSDWGTLTKNNFLKFDSITKLNMYFSPKYIIDDDGIFLSGFTTLSPRVKLNNLVSYNGTWNNLINVVDLSDNTYLLEMTINNISTSSEKATIPKSVMELYINNSSLIPDLSNFTNLKRIYFSNCEGNIRLINCSNLEAITITSCKNVNLTLEGCGNSEGYVDLAIASSTFGLVIFNGSYVNYLDLSNLSLNISFTGAKSNIKVVNLQNATLLNGELNISNLIADTLILNNISLVKVITSEAKTFRFLGLRYSNITLFGNTANTFDGSKLSNINSIRMIESVNSTVLTLLNNNTYTSNLTFRLIQCYLIKNVINLNINSSTSHLFYECKLLQSVTNSSITASGNNMFGRCYVLQTLPTSSNLSTITLNGTDATSMFLSCLSLSYDLIEKVLDKNSETKYWNSSTNTYVTTSNGTTPVTACKITNYNNFLYNKGYSLNTTIDLSKYAFGTSMQYCFCLTNWGGEENTNKNTTQKIVLTYKGKLPKMVTNAYSIFASISNYKQVVETDVLEDCSLLTNLSRGFANLNYSGENNYFFTAPTIPNNTGLNLTATFCGSRINIDSWKDNNNIIKMPSKVVNCSSCFGNAVFSELVEVSSWFSECTNILNLTACFNNCSNFTCTSVLDISSSNSSVNVAGLFARSSINSTSITYGFLGNWYSDPYANGYSWNHSTLSENNRLGPYNGVKIKLTSENIDIVGVIGNTRYNMRNVFQNATIDNSEAPLNITLSITTKDCSRICLNLKILDTSVDSPNKVTLSLNIENSNIETATYAFLNVTILQTENQIKLPNTLINGEYMFSGTNLTRLPLGLNNCSRLSNISYMFNGCSKLNTTLPLDVEYFLPISTTKIDYLFNGCGLLHGGIPENFILTTTSTQTIIDENQEELEVTVVNKNSITSLICTFASTAILLSDTSFQNNNNYEEVNIQDMFPNVVNVEGLFYYMCSSKGYSYSQPISPQSFSKCIRCDDLFNSATIVLPLNCDFTLATSLRFAFASGFSNYPQNLTLILLGNKVSDMSGIFSAENSTHVNTNVTNNLETLLNKKKGVYTGMLYGYSNDATKNEYKYIAPYRSIRYILHE